MEQKRYFYKAKVAETMNRNIYVTKIKTLLNILKGEIKDSGKLNLLDINVHAEDFYRDLLNLVYGWQLQNMNQWNQNAAGGDLWYDNGKIVIQVSSTATKDKIQTSIDKLSAEQFAGYRFKFLRIDGNVIKLRKESYDTHDDIVFDPSADIIDISTLLNDIAHLDIDCMRKVYELCKKEIVPLDTPEVTETDLAIVVKALATNVKDWSKDRRPIKYDIEKKIDFNHLEERRRLINDYKLYIGKLNAVYGEFVDNGTDCDFIILQNLSDMYSRYLGQYESNALFDKIVDEAKELALNSKSAEDIPVDRVNICINVIVVDAFIRCRIFEDPEGYSYVDA